MTIFQPGQQAYTQASGTTPTQPLFIEQRDPTVNDTTYKIGTFWLNTVNSSLWFLDSLSSAQALLQAQWVQIENHLDALEFLTGNSGGPVGPDANQNINVLGTGSITTIGNPATFTETIELTGLTNHNVLVGAGTPTITNVPPSTTGFVLTSNGASADPSFQDVSASGAVTAFTGNSGGREVPDGTGNFNILGTGSITTVGSLNTETVELTGLTNHNVLVGAGTATITKVPPSTAGFVLTSNGASADPSFQMSAGVTIINVQTFTSSGTYTPTAGMNYATLEAVGGGGGGGGCVASSSISTAALGGGGSGGGYVRKTVSAATIGASQSITVGAGGTGGNNTGTNGVNGGTSSIGAICSAAGGTGGAGTTVVGGAFGISGVLGGTGSGGDINATGGSSGLGSAVIGVGYSQAFGGDGGGSIFGGGGPGGSGGVAGSNPGVFGAVYGGGGGGAASSNSGSGAAGGTGAGGIVIITEYI